MRRSGFSALAPVLVIAGMLGACQSSGGLVGALSSGEKTSAPGVPIAVESIAGAPEKVAGTFTTAFASEAQSRQVELVGDSAKARYRVRGYLSANPTEDGNTALAFVWDVYDTQKKRAQRIQGASVGSGRAGGDPWDGVDQTTVSKAAAESMDAIAGFLVTNPASAPQPAATGRTRVGQAR